MALFIPAPDARRAGLKEGQTVDASISTQIPSAFGLLRDLPYGPFVRAQEETKLDRL